MHHVKGQYVIFKIEKFFISNLTSFWFDMMHNRNFDQWQVLYFMWKFWYLAFKIKKLHVFDLRHNKGEFDIFENMEIFDIRLS